LANSAWTALALPADTDLAADVINWRHTVFHDRCFEKWLLLWQRR